MQVLSTLLSFDTLEIIRANIRPRRLEPIMVTAVNTRVFFVALITFASLKILR